MAGLAKSKNICEAAGQPSLAREPAQPLVLIIESHEDTRQMLECLLTIWGYRAICAADGAEGLETAARVRPAAILTDAMLPLLDGLAVLAAARRSAALENVPIVFLSGRAEPVFRARALAAGACEYLVKPLGLNELETVLAECITKKPAARKQFFKGIY